ncbi:DnaJ-domain-containing protein [Cryphonectria parasitica EP155]|uniref:DnaJ-domain-containing protein n=1 Tax=Cryphonectria parasitica (strain ATCC 38755 / EP155) TaxID=660469 RepID=A0A9P5CKV5_CRYP1|nr:DnaJ-domain-containing protein [Cryphonectria parasitica EP155]KAF3761361.1 DnaJ-domain-containing protein [Cryphonectria parasitica EP155]
MSDIEENLDPEPPVIDPYEVLGLERDASPDQVKSAYRKAALKHHPDKVPESQKAEAHSTFQRIALANAILSDPLRRKRYDTTGSTSEAILDADGFNWTEYYREAYADSINADAINKFAQKYKGSDEEKDDVLVAYEKFKGNMDMLYETVMLSNVLEDDERFREIIDKAIETGDVKAFKAYTKESTVSKEARKRAARDEGLEAEEYAKELGVHDKLFGSKKGAGSKGKGKGKAKGKDSSEDALAALIRSRQKERGDAFLDSLTEKYGVTASSAKKGRKKHVEEEEEPDEEAFQAAAARLGRKKKASEDPAPKASKKTRR